MLNITVGGTAIRTKRIHGHCGRVDLRSLHRPNAKPMALAADPALSMVFKVVVTTGISSSFQVQGRIDFEH